MSVGAERSEFESGFHGLEGEGIDFDGIEEEFAALLAGEEIVNPGEETVAAELPGMATAFEADGFGEMQAMLAGLAGKHTGASDAVEDGGNFDEHVAGVAERLLLVAGELSAEMADPARGEARGERERGGFGGDEFFAVVVDGVVSDRAGGIEEDVVGSPVARGVEAQRELMVWTDIDVELGMGRVADLSGGIFSGKGTESSG